MGRLKDFLKTHGFGCIIVVRNWFTSFLPSLMKLCTVEMFSNKWFSKQDESHNLKSIKTQRTKAALEIISNSKRCVLLSGTPALSRPSELFPQVKALQPKLFKDM
jgi:hypothetical protein